MQPGRLISVSLPIRWNSMPIWKQIISACANHYYSGKTPILQIGQAIRRPFGPMDFARLPCIFLNSSIPKIPSGTRLPQNSKLFQSRCSRLSDRPVTTSHKNKTWPFLPGCYIALGFPFATSSTRSDRNMLQAQRIAIRSFHMSHPFIAQRILRSWGTG